MPTVHIDKSREAISRKTAIIVIAFMNNGIMFMTLILIFIATDSGLSATRCAES